MPAPYPVELKYAAVSALERGDGTVNAVAEQFGIGRTTLLTWARRLRERGTLDPAPPGGGNFSQVDVQRLLRVLASMRDATTAELAKAYNRGLVGRRRVHRSSILRALKREGFVFKKNVHAQPNRTAPTSAKSETSSGAG